MGIERSTSIGREERREKQKQNRAASEPLKPNPFGHAFLTSAVILEHGNVELNHELGIPLQANGRGKHVNNVPRDLTLFVVLQKRLSTLKDYSACPAWHIIGLIDLPVHDRVAWRTQTEQI